MAEDDVSTHTSVLLAEVIDALRPAEGDVFVDCTYGRGGHSSALLARIGPRGRVLALDRDPEAIAVGIEQARSEPRLSVEHGNFAELAHIAQRHGLKGKVDGILFDLGVSSPQLESSERGFSFHSDGALDMRMDTTEGESAAEWIARASRDDIARVLRDYGEERHARRIAGAIVAAREARPIVTSRQLAEIIAGARPRGDPRARGKHPATRCFQAIRIHVNRELEALQAALEAVPAILKGGGRLVVLSFHSLEDRMVKRFIRDRSRGLSGPEGPLPGEIPAVLRGVGKPVRPGDDEIRANPRARSAVLRVAERLP
jgi:16S rRNA (cytosine1402-N4)-methyltransferase